MTQIVYGLSLALLIGGHFWFAAILAVATTIYAVVDYVG
jgi:hypothetical protein